MDHNEFPEGGGYNIERTSEGGKRCVHQLFADGVQPEYFPHQREASAEDDPPGGDQCDRVIQGLHDRADGAPDKFRSLLIALAGSFRNMRCRDPVGIAVGEAEDEAGSSLAEKS